MNSNGRTVTSNMEVTKCFDTRLGAQSADAKVTIDIHLTFFSEQRAHFYVPGKRGPTDFVRLSSSFFVDCSGACFAKFAEPRSDSRREQPGRLQIQNGAVEPLPLVSTVRAPTQIATHGKLLDRDSRENHENVIALEPVGNQMVDGLLVTRWWRRGRCEL